MRSESDGHCLPTSFPGLAVSSVRRRRSLRPLLESRARPLPPDRGRVPRPRRAAARAERLGREPRPAPRRAGRGPSTAASSSTATARSAHVLLAPGHPGLERARRAARRPACRPLPTSRTTTRATVTVVGAGLAAATEWLNALAAGAEVISVRRREPVRRPLNVPRPLLLAPRARRLPPPRRRASGSSASRTLLAPSYPAGPRSGTSRSSARPGGPVPRRAVA